MPGKSAIEWTDDSWNPTIGCSKDDKDCEGCYAIEQAARLFEKFGQKDYEGITKRLPDGSINWTGLVRLLPERLEIPGRWTKPRKIFTDSMSDLFHHTVPYDYQALALDVMFGSGRHHVYQVLTKRPDIANVAIRRYLAEHKLTVLPEHIWIGTSAGFQEVADERIPQLLEIPAETRMLSLEPLIGPITLRTWLEPDLPIWPEMASPMPGQDYAEPLGDYTAEERGCRWLIRHRPPGGPNWFENWKPGIHWVITGGESGPKHRPFDPAWAARVRDECVEAMVAFFHKQNGGRVAKAGGRMLDGRTWEQFPKLREREVPFPYANKPHEDQPSLLATV